MKRYKILKTVFALVVIINFFTIGNSEAQTAGTFTFTINPVTHSGSYGAKHLVAIWIEDASGTFVKTKLKQSGNGNLDHLGTWTSKSASNVVDATTGSTLTSYSLLTIIWDGTNVSNTVVADGDYKVWIEMAWDDSKTTGKTVSSFSFTKGPAIESLTPANTNLFTDISLSWIPVITGLETVPLENIVKLFPNPTTGIINIDRSDLNSDCRIQVENTKGSIVFQAEIVKGSSGISTIDLSEFPDGLYFVSFIYPDQTENKSYKILLKK